MGRELGYVERTILQVSGSEIQHLCLYPPCEKSPVPIHRTAAQVSVNSESIAYIINPKVPPPESGTDESLATVALLSLTNHNTNKTRTMRHNSRKKRCGK